MTTRFILAELSREKASLLARCSPFMARHPVVGQSLPGLLNNMLAWMVPLLKLFTKFQIFCSTSRKRHKGRRRPRFCTLQPVGALFVTASAPRGAAVDRRLNRARSEALHSAEFGPAELSLSTCVYMMQFILGSLESPTRHPSES
jgi:hypothetical protein